MFACLGIERACVRRQPEEQKLVLSPPLHICTHKGSHDDSNRLAPLCCLVCSWFYKRVGYQGSGCQLLLPCQPGADQPRCGGQHHMERPWGSMTLLHHSRKPVCEKYITHYMTILVVSRGRICRESFTSCCSHSLSFWLTFYSLQRLAHFTYSFYVYALSTY